MLQQRSKMMSGEFAVCGQWQSFLRLSVSFKKASAWKSMVMMMGMREKVAGDDEEADE